MVFNVGFMKLPFYLAFQLLTCADIQVHSTIKDHGDDAVCSLKARKHKKPSVSIVCGWLVVCETAPW